MATLTLIIKHAGLTTSYLRFNSACQVQSLILGNLGIA